MNPYEMAEQLNDQYRDVFEKATMYGAYNGVEKDVYEDKLMNLFDLLMEAQHEGRPVEKIIGGDVESFCKSYFMEDESEKWWIKRLKILFRIMVGMFIFFGLDMFLPLTETENIFKVKSDVSPFIAAFFGGIIIDSILSAVVKPMIFKKKIKPMVYSVIMMLLWIGWIMGAMIMFDEYSIEIPSFWLWIVSGIYVVLYLLVRTVYRYKKYGRIRKYDKEERQIKKEFNQEITVKSVEGVAAQGMASRFKRLNKKRIKKGLPELTQKEYAAEVEKQWEFSHKIDKFLVLVFAAFIIVPAAHEMITNSIVEGLVLGALLFVIEFFIWRLFDKANKNAEISQKNTLEECEKEGITVVEYAERIK